MEQARYTVDFAKIYEEETLRLLDFQRQLAVEALERLANVGDLEDTNEAPASKRRKEFANCSEPSVEHIFDQREDENGSLGRGKGVTSGKKRGRPRRKPLGDKDVNRSSFGSDDRAHDEDAPRVEEVANEAELPQRAEGDSPHAMDASKAAAAGVTSGKKRGRPRRKPLGDIDVNLPSFVSDDRAHDEEAARAEEVANEAELPQRAEEDSSHAMDATKVAAVGVTSGKKRGRPQRKPLGDISVNRPSFVSDNRAHDEAAPRVEEVANETELPQRAERGSPQAMDATKVAAAPAEVAPIASNVASAVVEPVGGPSFRMTRSRAKVAEIGGAMTPAMSAAPPAKRQRRRKCDSKAICDSDPVVIVRCTDDGASHPTNLHTRVIADDLKNAASARTRSRLENESQSRQLSSKKVVFEGTAVRSIRPDAQIEKARDDEDGFAVNHGVVYSNVKIVGQARAEEDRPLACSPHQYLVDISSIAVQPSECFGISSGPAKFGSPAMPTAEGDTREEENCGAARILDECTDATNVETSTMSPIYSLPRMGSNVSYCENEAQADVRAEEGGEEDRSEILFGAKALEVDSVSLQTLPDVEGLHCRDDLSIQARSAGGQELLAAPKAVISRHAQDRVEQLDVDAETERQTGAEARRCVAESNDAARNAIEETCLEAIERKHAECAISSAGANQGLPENVIEIVPTPPTEAKFIKEAYLEERRGLELGEEQVQDSSGQKPPQHESDSAFVPVRHSKMCREDVNVVNVVNAAHAELNLVSSSKKDPQKPPPAAWRNSDWEEAVVSFSHGRTSAALNCEYDIPIPGARREKADERASSPTGRVSLSVAVDGANEMDIQPECSANGETENSCGRTHVSQSAAASDMSQVAMAASGRTCDSPRLVIEPKRMSNSTLDTEELAREQKLPALPSECTGALQPVAKSFDVHFSKGIVMDSHEPDPCASLDEGHVLEKNQGDQDSHMISLGTIGMLSSVERQSCVGAKTPTLENVDTCTKMRNSACGSDLHGDKNGLAGNMDASTAQVTPPASFVRLEQTTGGTNTRRKDCVQAGHFRTPCPRLDSFANFSASQMLASVSRQLPQKTDAAKPDVDGPGAERQTVHVPSATVAERDVSIFSLEQHTREDGNSAAIVRSEDPAAAVDVNETSSPGELEKLALELKLDDNPNGIGIGLLSAPKKHSICENGSGSVRKVAESDICEDHVLPPSERENSLCTDGIFAPVEPLQPVDHVAESTGGEVETSFPVVPLALAISRSNVGAEVQDVPESEVEPKTEWKRDRATGESVQSKSWSSAPRNGYPLKLASVLSPMMIETCRKAVRIVCKVSAERSGKVRSGSSAHEPITPFSLLRAVDGMERSSPIPAVPETGVLVIAPTPARSANLLPQMGTFPSSAQKPPSSIRKPFSVQMPSSSRKPSSASKPSSNLVASLRSFVPIVQQAQPSFLPNAKRTVMVKALVAAEAAKVKQQKRDLERAKRKRLAEDISQQNEKERENVNVRNTGSIAESSEGRKLEGDSSISGQQQKRQTGDRLPLKKKSGVGDRVNSQARAIPAVGRLTQAAGARSRIEMKAKKFEEDVKKTEMRREMRAKKYEDEFKKKGEELKRKEAKYLAWKQARDQEREKKRQRLDNPLKLRRPDEDQRPRAVSGNSSKISGRQDPNMKSTTREIGSLVQKHSANFATATTSVLHVKANVGSDTATSCLESPAPAQNNETELGGPTSYVISPYVKSSDEEMEDEDEEEDGNSQRRKQTAKPIPLWALKENLLPHLLRQVEVNPDRIFSGAKTCTLTEIFSTTQNVRYADFSKRCSLAWDT